MKQKSETEFGRVLATGADGKHAGLVVPELAKRGARVRGLLRRPDHADRVHQSGAAEIAIGDLNDPTRQAALQGVDAVFYLGPGILAARS